MARDLLHLAIYKLDTGSSMAAFEDRRSGVYLKNSKLLTDQRISEILAKVSVQDFESFSLSVTRRNFKKIEMKLRPRQYVDFDQFRDD